MYIQPVLTTKIKDFKDFTGSRFCHRIKDKKINCDF